MLVLAILCTVFLSISIFTSFCRCVNHVNDSCDGIDLLAAFVAEFISLSWRVLTIVSIWLLYTSIGG